MDEGFPFSDFQLKPFVDPMPVELQWCSKENQNDSIYEVNVLFPTWCFTI